MIKEIVNNVKCMRFDSLTEMAEYIEKNKEAAGPYGDPDNGSRASADWFGETVKDANYKLRMGDEELLRKFEKEESRVSITHEAESLVNDVQGSYVNMGAYLSGEPECMVDFQTSPAEKFVDINLSICFSAGTSSQNVLRKYMYVAKLVDELESSGHRCRIMLTTRTFRGSTKALVTVLFKKYQEALNLSGLLYVCCNTAYLRRNVLAVHNINLDWIGYSGPGDCRGSEESLKGYLHIPSMYSDSRTYTGTREDYDRWAKDMRAIAEKEGHA